MCEFSNAGPACWECDAGSRWAAQQGSLQQQDCRMAGIGLGWLESWGGMGGQAVGPRNGSDWIKVVGGTKNGMDRRGLGAKGMPWALCWGLR
jgi:hypothetical protein